MAEPETDNSSSGSGGGDDSGDSDSGDSDHSGSSGGGDDSSSDGGDSDSSHSGDGSIEESLNSGSGNSGSGDSGERSGSSGSGSSAASTEHGSDGPSKVSSTSGKSSNSGRADADADIDEDEHGDRTRHGEVVLLSSTDGIAASIAKRGLKIIEVFQLASLGMQGLRIEVPDKQTGKQVIATLHKIDPKGISTFNHIYSPARGTASEGGSGDDAPSAGTPAQRTAARIGLVDAGVDATHPLLKGVKISVRAFGMGATTVENHGTAVASRIAEVAPGATLVVASVFSEMKNGEEIASVDAIARGLDWLSRNNVPVINLSLSGPANPILEAVTARLIAKGHVLVAAVGNEGPNSAPQYPAAYEKVVGVTAVDAKDHIYLYANQGSYVDFAAKGVNAKVAKSPGTVETVSGTSYAAPVVAVAIARMLPHADPQKAEAAQASLAQTARDLGEPGRDPVYGFGVIDAKH